ncbi:hypothetical protein [Candidatus Chloroploca sp. Khr17]|uniref:hypothetical protein n=1 Tax=Candidatus Chloroploca sp. Khr17 TaxID=2496869 RepID=UPI00101D209D|nr:hypothetical protein [Candidatus Chloroploca sp. Khr17]
MSSRLRLHLVGGSDDDRPPACPIPFPLHANSQITLHSPEVPGDRAALLAALATLLARIAREGTTVDESERQRAA